MYDINNVLHALSDLRTLQHEEVWVIGIKRSKSYFTSIVKSGTENRCEGISFDDIENILLNYNCKNYIIAHNHPNEKDYIFQSCEDNDFTKWMKKISSKYGYNLLDHIIIGPNCHFSYNEHKWKYYSIDNLAKLATKKFVLINKETKEPVTKVTLKKVSKN